MFQTKAKLIKNIEVAKNYYKILLSCASIAKIAKPGQFLNVKITNGCEPLLRRPFGIHRVRVSNIEILFEVVGKGTEILSKKKEGYLDIIGPLGNGFDLSETTRQLDNETTILVAGGMGVAPLVFLAEKLTEIPNSKFQIPKILIGAKTKKQILCEKEFKELGCELKIATDDGSRGFKGKATDLLKTILRGTRDEGRGTIYACGPRPMLKEIANISKKYNIPAQVSLEEHMACGIGACLGCVVKTRDEGRGTRDEFIYKRVCKEGPVFDAREIIWE